MIQEKLLLVQGKTSLAQEKPSLAQEKASSVQEKPLLLFLTASVFLVGVNEFMLAAMLGPLGDAFHTSSAGAAWLISGYAFSYALAAPLLGYVSDRVARSKLLHIALLLFGLDGASIAFAPSIEVAIGLRVLGGLASAILIPTSFALIAETVPKVRQASAMGMVLLGMTFGIALGPAMAGLLTTGWGWRAPFWMIAFGGILAFAIGRWVLPKQGMRSFAEKRPRLAWFKQWWILRPLIAKGAWNGAGVSAFLLSGQILEQRYHLGVACVGMSVASFGVGLGVGNLLAGPLQRVCRHEEYALVVTTLVLFISITLFVWVALPLVGALICLACWGAALGAGAPLGTVVLAARSGSSKGMVLACSETLNNIAILATVPLAAMRLLDTGVDSAMIVFAVGLGLGIALTWADAMASRR